MGKEQTCVKVGSLNIRRFVLGINCFWSNEKCIFQRDQANMVCSATPEEEEEEDRATSQGRFLALVGTGYRFILRTAWIVKLKRVHFLRAFICVIVDLWRAHFEVSSLLPWHHSCARVIESNDRVIITEGSIFDLINSFKK